jgi:predicted O-methyltransferase YrrM
MGDSRELDPEVTSWLVSTRARAKCSGQVQESNGKGLAISLYRLALLVSGALEIGTFKGCGSTLIIAKGLLDGGTGGKLWTVESDEEIAKEARRAMTISNLPVDVIHGMGSPAHMSCP